LFSVARRYSAAFCGAFSSSYTRTAAHGQHNLSSTMVYLYRRGAEARAGSLYHHGLGPEEKLFLCQESQSGEIAAMSGEGGGRPRCVLIDA
jgi:hypothetical protein